MTGHVHITPELRHDDPVLPGSDPSERLVMCARRRVPHGLGNATRRAEASEKPRLDRDRTGRKYVPVADGPPRDGADRAAVT
jgi:hypothetical protein